MGGVCNFHNKKIKFLILPHHICGECGTRTSHNVKRGIFKTSNWFWGTITIKNNVWVALGLLLCECRFDILSPGYPLNRGAGSRRSPRAGCQAGGWCLVCTAQTMGTWEQIWEHPAADTHVDRDNKGLTAAVVVGEQLVQLLLDLGQLIFCEPPPGLCCLWLLLWQSAFLPPWWWGRGQPRGWDGSCGHTFWESLSDYLETWENVEVF